MLIDLLLCFRGREKGLEFLRIGPYPGEPLGREFMPEKTGFGREGPIRMLDGSALKADLSRGGDSANISESESVVDIDDLPPPLPSLSGG